MSYRYVVIGSGRQGTAAAARVNDLLGQELAQPATVDASDLIAIKKLLLEQGIDTMLVGTPYFFHQVDGLCNLNRRGND